MQLNNSDESDYPLDISGYIPEDYCNITIPLIYSIIENHEYDNVILIHDKINNPQEFALYANSKSLSIIYNESSSNDELSELLNKYFTNIKRIAFVFHNTNIDGLKEFTNNKPLFDYNDLEINTIDYSLNMQFIINIANQFNVQNLDYLACNTLLYDHWKKYFDILKVKTTTTIGASNDETGNIKYGGDWVLENTNEDIRNIYFTNSVENYQYTLATTFLSQNGGTYYFRQVTSTSLIEYSSNNSTWTPILNGNWPIQITNSSPSSSNILTVMFNTDITIGSSIGTNGYFIINSQYITINGNNKVVPINGVTNYPGLFQNGTGSNNGYTNIIIKDLGVITSNNNSTLGGSGGGWIGQQYFGRYISSGTITVTNCYSTGNISSACGGIFGYYTGQSSSGGTITVSNCYNTGTIGDSAGGIFGVFAGSSATGGTITVTNCYSTGSIQNNGGGIFGKYTQYFASGGTIISSYCNNIGTIGDGAGGIFGNATLYGASSTSSITATNCYSTGTIGSNGGGIFGNDIGSYASRISITVSNCYSTGIINSFAGGIFGANAGSFSSGGTFTITVTNCYSTGNIGITAGGIFGYAAKYNASSTSSITVTNCYSTGTIGDTGGGIFGAVAGRLCKGGTITSSNCYSIGSIGIRAGGIFGSNT